MAKGTISKGKKGHSKHSRAARRAASPSIDVDKSLKEVRPPQESIDRRPAVLAAHHSGGVAKKAKSGRKAVLSSKARRRQEKNLGRAEAVMERTALKVQKSKGHAKVINSRKKTWEEINREVFEREERAGLSKKAKTKMEEDAMVAAFYADQDGDAQMEGVAEDEVEKPNNVDAISAQSVSVPATAPVEAEEEEEEVL